MNLKNCFFFVSFLFLLISAPARAVGFDVSAGYVPFFVFADSSGLGQASYTRFVGLGLRFSVWTSKGVVELDSLSGFELSPYLQDISVMTLSFRQYLFRQHDYGPEDFWQQTSLRRFEPYYALGVGRLEQQSSFLTQSETIGVLNIRSWGPSASVGVEWFFARGLPGDANRPPVESRPASGGSSSIPAIASPNQDPFSAFAELRVLTAIWPETVPAFLFYKTSLTAGVRYRF
jgi:hypothetical protein